MTPSYKHSYGDKKNVLCYLNYLKFVKTLLNSKLKPSKLMKLIKSASS